MAEPQMALPHKLTLEQRNSLTMTGVTEVVSFDENAVIVNTDLGRLTVQGQQLQLKTLSVEGGQIAVEGHIAALQYEEPRQKGGWVHRLFG
jgi:sporulation protein YabP